MSEGKQFWANRWNVIDGVILCAVCGAIFMGSIDDFGEEWQIGNLFGASVVALRYSIQIFRLLRLIKVSKDIHEQKKYQGMISLKPGVDL